MIVNIVRLGAIVRTEHDWRGGRKIPSRGRAGPSGIARPMDVEVRAPDLLEERFVLRLGYPPRDACCVGEAHLH